MVKQLNDKGVGVKFAYISLAEQISGRSSRLLDEAKDVYKRQGESL